MSLTTKHQVRLPASHLHEAPSDAGIVATQRRGVYACNLGYGGLSSVFSTASGDATDS